MKTKYFFGGVGYYNYFFKVCGESYWGYYPGHKSENNPYFKFNLSPNKFIFRIDRLFVVMETVLN